VYEVGQEMSIKHKIIAILKHSEREKELQLLDKSLYS